MNESTKFFDNLTWLNASEAADYLRISIPNLRTKVCRHQIKAYKLGNRLRFKKSELDQLMESNLSKGDSYDE